MSFPKFLKSVTLLLAIGAMSASCSGGSAAPSSNSSDFISSLISGDSWSSDTGFSHSSSSYSSEETPRDVTITFATGEGSTVAPITVQSGYAFEEGAFERPILAHYEFLGWYLDSNYNLAVHYPYTATHDVVLYAKWAPIRHLVRFVTGTVETMNPIYVNDGDYLQEPVAPENGRSKFAGWYLDEELTQKAYFPYIVNSPVTFYAKYEIVWRTITFHVNGGSTIQPLLVEDGEIFTDPFESPTHPYFQFAGWYYDDQFQNPVQYPLIVTGNLDLFAKWANTEATITFVTNGGSVIDPIVVDKGSVVRSLPNPTLENAVFLGWYFDNELTNPVSLPLTLTQDVTLYAGWLLNRSRLSFETNGGNTILPIDKNIGDTVEENEVPTPTRGHYSFAGWYLDPNFVNPALFPLTLDASVTLYAKWTAENYTVTFHCNGGSAVETKTITYGQSIVSSPETVRTGYEFLGWFLDAELTEKANFPLAVSYDLHLYAKWKEITYSVSLNTNGAQDFASIGKKYGEMLEESEVPTPSKSRNTFLGWYLDFELTQKAIFPIQIVNNITLHAKWEYISTFSVRFDANGGSGGAYYVVESGASIDAVPEPSRPGYTFAGWCLDIAGTTSAQFPYTVTQSVTFYAKWEALSCLVTYYTNGGDDIPVSTMAYGDELTEAPTPVKEGSVFLGWYLDPNFNTPAAFPMIVTEDLGLYAKWREITYCTVSFYNDGQVNTVKVEKGKAVEEPAAPTKNGYTFMGWYLDADYTIAANFPYLVTDSMSFYARWQRNEGTVTVTFETNGGTSVASSVLQVGGTLSEPTSPVSARGEFLGWYTDEALTSPAIFPMEVFNNLTLYAKYASYEQTYTVSFDSNGGSLVPSQIIYATGSLIASPTAPTNPGMVFLGWYLDEELTLPASFPMAINENTTLYAKWSDDPGIYRVTLHDGVNADNIYLLNPGDTLSRPNDPVRQGYVFGGWYTNEACTGMAVSFPYTPRGDVTLYAKWTLEVVEYTVTWVYNDGSSNQEQTVDNGTSISGRTPTREGYDFAGWYTDPELTRAVSFPYRVNGDVTFYAKWEKQAVTYTVSYQTSGGTTIPSTTVSEGGSISVPANPSKSGFVFTGWYLDPECTQKATFPMNISGDTVLYAGWRVDEFANFTFEYNETLGGYVLTDYEGDDTNVAVPENYNDGVHGSASVVAIGKSAFENCAKIVSITIPDTVTSIGDSAFFGCASLQSITIPASVTSLGSRTFYKCAALTEVNLPDTITSIGAWSFYGCSSLKTIILPSELTSISDYMFYSSGLERIVIRSNCRSIGNFAFYNCVSLTQVDIAEGCTSIGNNAFRSCGLLRQINIPITVTTIGSYVFVDDEFIVVYCSHGSNPDGFNAVWARISSDQDNTSTAPVIYNYGGAYTRVGDIVYALLKDGSVSATYIGPRDVTSVTIEDQVEMNDKIYDVTVIGTRGFRNLKSLTSVTLPKKLQVVGSYAFQACSALTSINLPISTLTIDSYAFFNCTSLSAVTIPTSLTAIGNFAFRNCTSIKEIYIPKSVVSLDPYAFSQCNGIVIMYGGSYFEAWDVNCVKLVNSAGKYCYQDGLYYSLTMDGTVCVSMGDNGLLSANVASQVELDGTFYNVTSIGPSAFSGQTLLETVILPDTITVIENNAFNGCSNLTNVTLGRGITSIKAYAFAHCSQLRIVELNSSLKTIESNIFQECPNHVTLLVKGEPFQTDPWYYDMGNYRYFSVAFDYSGKYVVIDYVVYALTKNGVVAAGNIGNLRSMSIRDNVEIDGVSYPVIGVSDFAFSGMSDLSSVTFGSNIKTIGRYAFYYASLTEVTIPESVTSIGAQAFDQGDKKMTIFVATFSVNASFDYPSAEHVYFGTVGPLFTYDGNDYGVTLSGGAILLNWNGNKNGEIDLPGAVTDGEGASRALQAIGQDVFRDANNINKITLPAGLIAICNRAFYNCTALQTVEYSGMSLETIGQEAFYNCYNLTSANFVASATLIHDRAFQYCRAINEITFGNTLTSIGDSAFFECYQLPSINLPNSLKTVGSHAFYNCYNAGITLGNSLETIAAYAFSSCGSVDAIAFGPSLRSIGEGAFYATNIKYVFVPKTVTLGLRAFSSGIVCFGAETIDEASLNVLRNGGASVFLNCKGVVYSEFALYVVSVSGAATLVKYYGVSDSFAVLDQISLGGVSYNVTSIGDNAFRGNDSLQKLTLAETISSIGSYAFANCTALKDVVWGSGVRSIGNHAFESCFNLKAIILPEGLTTISDYAFSYVTNATVLLPSSINFVGKNAFVSSNIFLMTDEAEGVNSENLRDCVVRSGCEALARIDDFDYVLFADHTALVLRYYGNASSVVMADTVTYQEKDYQIVSLGSGLFASCATLEEVTLPSTITELPPSLFNGCSLLESVTIPENVTIIGDHAFADCYALYSLILNDKIVSVGAYAFANCNSLTAIEFGSSLENIGDYAFSYCSSLNTAALGANAKQLGDYAFQYCSSLKAISLGQSLTSIGAYAFYYCSSLASVSLPDSLVTLGTHSFHNSGISSISFGGGLKVIPESAFSVCQNLRTVEFNNALTEIGAYAFYNCGSLNSIVFGTGLQSIGNSAFESCWGLQQMILPNGLISIGSNAFANSNLRYAFVPSTVTAMGDQCFTSGSIYFGSSFLPNANALGSQCVRVFNCAAIAAIDDMTMILMKNGSASIVSYSGTATNLTLSDFDYNGRHYEITSIYDEAFRNSSIVSIALPSSLTTIGKHAFRYCYSLASVTFAKGLQAIEEGAFAECYNLRNVILPNGLESLGKEAFRYDSLSYIYVPSSVKFFGDYCISGCTVYLSRTSIESETAFENCTFVYNCDGIIEENGYFYVLNNNGTASLKSYSGSETAITLQSTIEFENKNYSLTEISDNVFTSKNISSISFPDTLTSIGNSAFQNCWSLTSITFPDGLLSIGDSAFADCNNISAVKLPSGIATLGDRAFVNVRLNDVYIPVSVTSLGVNCFNNTKLYIEAPTLAGANAQEGCSIVYNCAGTLEQNGYFYVLKNDGSAILASYSGGETNIVLPNKLELDGKSFVITEIGEGVFRGSSLSSISLPDTLTSIGNSAFQNCWSLTSITFPDGLLSIGDSAFADCNNITEVNLPNGIISIGAYAFNNVRPRRVYIPVSVISLGVNCFGYISLYVAAPTLPGGNTQDGCSITYNCAGIIEDNGYFYVLKNDGSAILASYSGGETDIVLPNKLELGGKSFVITEIGEGVFRGSSLSSITLNSGLTTIGAFAFADCFSLTKISFPDSLATLGERAFNGTPLRYVFIPSALKSIGNYCFNGTTLYVMAASLANEEAAPGCSIAYNCAGVLEENGFLYVLKKGGTATLASYTGSQTALVLPVTLAFEGEEFSLIEIGSFAFVGSTISSISLPSTLAAIGNCAFQGCSKLTEISLPTGLQSIGESAFYGTGITRFYVPASVASLGNGCFSNATIFFGAATLVNPNAVSSCVTVYDCCGFCEENGMLFALKNNKTALLLSYSGDNTDVVLPSMITHEGAQFTLAEIADRVFNNKTLTSIVLPEGLVSIGDYAFAWTTITSLSLPSSLRSVGNYAFAECKQLSSVTFASGLVSIGDCAFYYCERLTSVSLPDTLQTIGMEAFRNTALRNVWISSGVAAVGSNAFNNVTIITDRTEFTDSILSGFGNCTFVFSCKGYVTVGSLSFLVYDNGTAEVLSYTGDASTVVIPEKVSYGSREYSVIRVRASVFANNTVIVSVSLPATVVEIGESAFAYCTLLTDVNLANVKIIRANAFYESALVNAMLSSAIRIEENAFCQYRQGVTFAYVGPNVTYIGCNAFYSSSNNKTILMALSTKGSDWNESWSGSNYNINFIWDCAGYSEEGSLLYYVIGSSNELGVVALNNNITTLTLGGTFTINGKEYSLEKISAYAFANSAIEELVLAETVTEIGQSAFAGCTSLRKITFTNVETISNSAFQSCSNLTDIAWGSALTEIGDYAFDSCSKLKSVLLPLGVTTVRYGAFGNCSSLEAIYVPQTVASFSNQYGTKAIIMTPLATVNWGSDGAPIVCNATGEYFVDDDFVYAVLKNTAGHKLVALAGYKGAEKDLVLPSSAANGENVYEVTTVASYVFYRANLTSVVLPSSLTTVKQYAFNECEKLTRIEILSGTNFDTYSFYMLRKLKMVLIHQGVRIANGQVFQFDGENQQPVFLIEGDTSGWSSSFAYRWNSAMGLEWQFVVVEKATFDTAALNGVTYALRSDRTAVAISAEEDVTSISFPESVTYQEQTYLVTQIAQTAFFRHMALEEVVIPATITYVGAGAFANCYSLTSVNWSASCSEILDKMFAGDMMLQDVTLNSDVLNYIYYRAFYACSSLTSIVLPASVNQIASEAFDLCSELAHVYSRKPVGDIVYVDGSLPNDVQIEYGYENE
ncbi:MAG: leucine-rich repeat protein [Bacilli bacterium]|nr:leucine-rich repeat protein [Bacilli bacterium]